FSDDENTLFGLDVIKTETGWTLNFTITGRDGNSKTSPERSMSISLTDRFYENYKDALVDGYHISEMLGIQLYDPEVRIWILEDEDDEAVLDKVISMDQVIKWYTK